jgi:hypothetical protein
MMHQHSTDDGMRGLEQGLAWIFALVAAVLALIGLLVGFGIIGPAGVDIEGAGEVPGIEAAVVQGSFWDAVVWMLPAIAAGALSWALGRADHAHMREGMGRGLHMGAYAMGLVTVVLSAIALLVGFNLLDLGHVQTDGALWGFAAIASGFVTGAMHSLVPSAVADEDYLVRLVETRVSATRPTTGPGTVPGTERMP